MRFKQRLWIFALMDLFIIRTIFSYNESLFNAHVKLRVGYLLLGMLITVSLCFSIVFNKRKKASEYAIAEKWSGLDELLPKQMFQHIGFNKRESINPFFQKNVRFAKEHLNERLFLLAGYKSRADGLVMEG